MDVGANMNTGEEKGSPNSEQEERPFGEVGRVLLSSTILGNSKGIQATCHHFASVLQDSSVSKENGRVHNAATTKSTIQKKRKGVANSKRKKQQEKHRTNEESVHALQEAIHRETESFLKLAGSNSSLLAVKLDQQRRHNALLRKRLLKVRHTVHEEEPSWPERIGRWRSPRYCGYASDSTVTSSVSSRPFLPVTKRAELLKQARELIRLLEEPVVTESTTTNPTKAAKPRPGPGTQKERDSGLLESAPLQQIVEKRDLILMALQYLRESVSSGLD